MQLRLGFRDLPGFFSHFLGTYIRLPLFPLTFLLVLLPSVSVVLSYTFFSGVRSLLVDHALGSQPDPVRPDSLHHVLLHLHVDLYCLNGPIHWLIHYQILIQQERKWVSHFTLVH